ncbi:MAG TPA: DUF4389 domain-containing protein [Solirubrobacterales bacterium]|nr:DUF4389 domain-containing protein [Solirubrobacterales bacterium]
MNLILSDNLQRSRGTVFFRVIFALPFLIWLAVWAVAAFFVAFVTWIATLFEGRPPAPLHNFLARFVRFATHTYAYLNLAAEPLPAFDGKPGYPVDVAIEPPVVQNRWTVAFRLVLAIPALLLLGALFGSGVAGEGLWRGEQAGVAGLLGTAAMLAWFYALVRARIDRGLRDLIAYVLSYGAQAWGYLLLVTDEYPDSDPLTAIGPLPTRSDPIRMEVTDGTRRSRLTVFFRLALAFPHLVWLSLWGVLAFFAVIVNWFAVLFTGTSPQGLHRFLARFLRYSTHVFAFLYLVANPFPGFAGAAGSYPVELHVAEPGRQNRWTAFFRLVLAIPALLLAGAFSQALAVVAVLGWFAALFTAEMPLGLRNLGALALRYGAQAYGYVLLLTGAYPYSGPCHEVAPPPPAATATVTPVPPAVPAR